MHKHPYWQIEKDLGVVAYRPAYARALKDVVTAVLLSQIIFWFKPDKQGKSKLRVVRGGRLWLAKSREEMMEETGLTLDQYRRSIRKLKSKGLVETKIMMFDGVTTPHIRLGVPALQALMAGSGISPQHVEGLLPNGKGDFPTPIVEGLPSHQLGDNPSTITESTSEIFESTTENTEQANASAFAEEQATEKENNDGQGKEEKKKETLEGLWKIGMETYYTGYKQCLTVKERARLKKIGIACGEDTRKVIDHVFEHWQAFGQKAQLLKGLATYPMMPHLGFLLANVGVALQFLADDPPQWKKPGLKLVEALPEVEDIPVVEETPLTPEQIAADLALFDDLAAGKFDKKVGS